MGAADIVPGVSGGTMAFITGIYDRLLAAIRHFDLALLRLLLAGKVKAAWQHVDGAFLLALVAGIAISMLSLARGISWLLENHPVPLWAFFFGLILASTLVLIRQVPAWTFLRSLWLVIGTGVALTIALSPIVGFAGGLTGVFLAGFIAICAMILPGISGSFILVLLGMYATILAAITQFDLTVLVVFAAGAGSGLMVFSRILHWLLQRAHASTMALLTGFLLGSLAVVWPWKQVLDWVVDRHGELKAVQQIPVSPAQYLTVTGNEPQVALCTMLMVTGFALVWFIESRYGSVGSEG
ncbi:MAG: DUF368 domain-containing protein [Halieaceae bacterium]|nr:DUF368 domain-containing protein [Halieaceae bacterium]